MDPKTYIKGCKNCELSSQAGVTPVPFTSPETPAGGFIQDHGIVVIGEAPGRQENSAGVPFVGPSGTLARSWIKPYINPVDIGYMNVVSCWPQRTPTAEEVTACVPNVELQLNTLRPAYCLIFGGVALTTLCPIRSVTIGSLHGHFWTLTYGNSSAMAMATYHPAAVLRNPHLESDVTLDIETFFKVVDGELEPAGSNTCVRCKKEPVEVVVARLGLGRKCKRFARAKVIQEPLFEWESGREKYLG